MLLCLSRAERKYLYDASGELWNSSLQAREIRKSLVISKCHGILFQCWNWKGYAKTYFRLLFVFGIDTSISSGMEIRNARRPRRIVLPWVLHTLQDFIVIFFAREIRRECYKYKKQNTCANFSTELVFDEMCSHLKYVLNTFWLISRANAILLWWVVVFWKLCAWFLVSRKTGVIWEICTFGMKVCFMKIWMLWSDIDRHAIVLRMIRGLFYNLC